MIIEAFSESLQPWWDRLAALPARTAYAVLAGLGALSAAVSALLGWLWLGDDFADQAVQAQRLSSRWAQQGRAVAPDLGVLRQQETLRADAVFALEASWADPATAPALWWQAEAAALAQGLSVESFQPGPPAVLPDRVEQPAILRLKGRYANLAAWLSELAADKPAVGVRRLSLQLEPDGLLRVDVTLVRLQRLATATATAQIQPVPSALPSIAAQPAAMPKIPDPFAEPASPAPAPVKPQSASRRLDPLQAWPLADLRVAGVMRQQGQAVALVQVAGRVHAVRVGDGLGEHQGEVVHIDEGGLVLREWTGQSNGPAKPRDVRLQVGQRAAP